MAKASKIFHFVPPRCQCNILVLTTTAVILSNVKANNYLTYAQGIGSKPWICMLVSSVRGRICFLVLHQWQYSK